MSMTPSARAAFLNGITGKSTSGLVISNCYIGLSSTTPNADGSNFTEPTVGDYARAIIGINGQSATMVMGAPNNGIIENNKIIYFPEATASWGTLTYFGLFSGPSGGTPLIFGVLTSPISVGSGYVALFRVGSLELSIS